MPLVAIIHIGIDPRLQLGPITLRWYGVMYAVAFWVAFHYGARPHLEARGVAVDRMERIAGWTIGAGLLGGRLYYVAQTEPGYYLTHPLHILAVWEGGMAFFGSIFASVATLALLARRHRLSFWLLLDAGVLFGAIGQPIGRIGNLINGDILGAPSTLPWATAYTNAHAVLQQGFQLGTPYQPAAAYEAIGTLAILGVLLLLRRRGVKRGILGLAYLALYPISQLIIFQWRATEPTLLLGLKQAQLTSLALLVIGVPVLWLLWLRQRANGERGDPAGGRADAVNADRAASSAMP